MPRKVSEAQLSRIMEDAERGARLEAAARVARLRRMGHPAEDDSEARVARALKYAAWRIGAYEAGECASPW